MKLSYRGINYHQNPVLVNSNEFKTIGKYRGKYIELHKFNNIALQKHCNHLTYRGVSYS